MAERKTLRTVELNLTGFHFPRALSNDQANFRMVVDVRYLDAEGRLAVEHAILPGIDTYWECDTRRADTPGYVRAPDRKSPEATLDMSRIDDWTRMILTLRTSSLHSIRFKVFDVNRKDAWDHFKDYLGPVVQALVGRSGGLAQALPTPAPEALGAAADDLRSYLLGKLGGGDDILFRGSGPLQTPDAGPAITGQVEGAGVAGTYRITWHARCL